MGGSRGRLISSQDREQAILLVNEANKNGARKCKACELLGITLRALERWEKEGKIDRRKGANRVLANKLTEEERANIIGIINSEEYRDLPPCQIVPRLADKGLYIASESSMYRILREEKQLVHRGLTQPRKHKRPEAHQATGPNQVWSWDSVP